MPAENPPPGGRLQIEEDGGALIVRIANETRANALDDAILDALVSLLEGPRAATARGAGRLSPAVTPKAMPPCRCAPMPGCLRPRSQSVAS